MYIIYILISVSYMLYIQILHVLKTG